MELRPRLFPPKREVSGKMTSGVNDRMSDSELTNLLLM